MILSIIASNSESQSCFNKSCSEPHMICRHPTPSWDRATHQAETSKRNGTILGFKITSDKSPCVQMLTPIFNLTSETRTKAGKNCVRQKFSSLRWTVKKHLISLLRVHTVYCNTTTAQTSLSENELAKKSGNPNSTSLSTDAGAVVTVRRYKLLDEEVEEFIQNETPMERLRRYSTKDEATKLYPGDIEVMRRVLQGAILATGLYGITKGGQESYLAFKRRNQFTMYVSSKAMHKRMRARVTFDAMKEAIRLNLRMLCLVLPVLAVEKGMSIYRNKSSPLHMATGVGVSMGLYKFQQGPRATLAAIVLGGALGLVFGTGQYMFLRLVGNDQETSNRKMVYHLISQNRSCKKSKEVTDKQLNDSDDEDID